MPHQDTADLPTPLESLQSLLELISDQQLQDVQRHGNASIRANVLAITALVVFGWTKKDSLTERFQIARDVVHRLLPNQTQVRSRQGLFSALKQCCDCLLKRIRRALISRLEHDPCWLLAGKPTFAVDGSKFAVPRSARNLAFFAAASRKSKGAYKTQADLMKAATTQISVLLCQHLGESVHWPRSDFLDLAAIRRVGFGVTPC